ncbi:MAG: sensor histidine kinase [Nitrososphaeraceae archaeon]|nr:sensor histidine kinase [Nitrososphaeraceae archaeon]
MISFLLSLFYYQYHIIITEEIRELATSDVKSNIEIQIHDLSKLLDENIDSILDNLKIVANNEKFDSQEIRKSELASLSTDAATDLGDLYIWINKDGEEVWSSEGDFYFNLNEIDVNSQDFFYTPRDTLKPSIGSVFFDSKYTNLEGWYVSYPIISEKEITTSDYSDKGNDNNSHQLQGITQKEFNGVVMALIDAETLGQFLQQKIPQKYDASINLFDMDGNIVYSTDPFFMTKDIYSLDLDNPLVTNIHNSVISLLNSSFYNDNSVVYDIPERKVSIAYQPVYLDYSQHKQEQKYQPFTILSLSATHKLANDVSYLLDQERLFSILIIVAIFIVSISIALIIVIWNKRLKNIVKFKTLQLRQSNKNLQSSNRQLKLHDKLQKDFINIAAHELRTPVQVISGYTEMIIEDIKKYVSKNNKMDKTNIRNDKNGTTNEISIIPRIDAMVKAIDRNSSRLYKLTSDLIDVIQIEQNKLELKKDRFDLNENIEDIIQDFKKLKSLYYDNLKDVEIIFHKSETSIIVVGDRMRITQVIFNLLSNSLKSTETGKIIVSIYKRKKNEKYISNSPANSYDNSLISNKKIQLISKHKIANYHHDISSEYEIIVVVKDTGSGLSSEIKSNLFEKFSSKSEKGIGLGLYISKKIIEAHNGNIWAENNHDCKGTTFTFTLPLK